MLVTNQQLDKLATSHVEFKAHGMLDHTPINMDPVLIPQSEDDDHNGDAIDGDVLSEVKLAWGASM